MKIINFLKEYVVDDTTEKPEEIELIHIKTKNILKADEMEDENDQKSEVNLNISKANPEADQSQLFTESDCSEDNETEVVTKSTRYILKKYKCKICNVTVTIFKISKLDLQLKIHFF